MDHAALVQKHFGGELGLIANPSLRQLVIDSTAQFCAPYFWERPAAKGNRFHPEVSCGDGGLVRHVKYACWCAMELMRAWDQYPEGTTSNNMNGARTRNQDVIIAALILHDMMKEGDPFLAHLPERQGKEGSKLIGGCHGIDMASAMYFRLFKGQVQSREHWSILYAIAGHMGVWTADPAFIPQNIADPEYRHIALLTAGADYFSSRKADAQMRELLAYQVVATSQPNGATANA